MARFQFRFWLDCDKDDELLLAETIDWLKQQRTFTATVRDGIRLILDLRAGRLDVLLALFPWVEADIEARARAAADVHIAGQLSRLERLLLQGSAPANGGGPRPMALPKVAGPLPVDDDDTALLTVRKAKVDGKQIAQNFINSMMRLQQ